MVNAYIKCISYYLPNNVFTNDDIEKEFPEWSVEKVTSKLGVKSRHISSAEETASDLAIKASENLIKENKVDVKSIDFVLLCTQSPDYFLPTTACIIQNELGIPTSAGALDFNLGCSGYVYGLSIAKGLIAAGIAKNILFITSETYSKYINRQDKSNRAIFGDAAAASLISVEGKIKIGDFVLGTDGSGANDLMVKTGCSKFPDKVNHTTRDDNGYFFSPDDLYMNGSKVFNFTLNAVPKLINATLKKSDIERSDVDFFVFHQANKFMLNTLRKVCKIDEEKFYIDMEDVGNTVSSTLPIALSRMISNKKLFINESKLIIAGFGVGYSWASCVLDIKINN